MPMSFRDLDVWRRSMAWAVELHRVTKTFPRDESFGLTSQVRRSALSVPSNIAEGHGRLSTRDFKQFLGVARGSLREAETQLEIAAQLGYGQPDALARLIDEAQQIGRMLSSFITTLTAQSSGPAMRARSSKLEARS